MSNLRKTVATAMLISLCVVLPMVFHFIPQAGGALLPMHIPVLLAGLICGWKFGLITGIAGPLLSSMVTGMPPTGMVPVMMIELGTYGLVTGILSSVVRTRRIYVDLYVSLIIAMLVGRVISGIARAMFFFGGSLSFFGGGYTLALWVSSYFITSVPGIIIQLVFIPSLVIVLERARAIPRRYQPSGG